MGQAVARRRSRAEILDEAQRALDMRLRGFRDFEVCRELGISRATLNRRVKLALEQRLNPTVDQYRDEQRERITVYRRRILDELEVLGRRRDAAGRMLLDVETGETIIVAPDTAASVAALLGRLTQLEERLARLDGLDAPTRVSVESTVDAELAALAEQLAANDRHTATPR